MMHTPMMMSIAQQRSEEARQRAERTRLIRQARASARPRRGHRAGYRLALAALQPQS